MKCATVTEPRTILVHLNVATCDETVTTTELGEAITDVLSSAGLSLVSDLDITVALAEEV